jgi:phage shock protein E
MDWRLLLAIAVVLIALFVLKRASFVSANTARQLLQQGALVVDVRSAGEFNSGHVPGALNIELGNLKSEALRRFPDKNQVLLLHCLSGGRSGIARQQLKSLGYANVYNLGSYTRAEAIVRAAQ